MCVVVKVPAQSGSYAVQASALFVCSGHNVRASLTRLQVFERGDDRDRTYSMQDFPPGAPLRRGGVPFTIFFDAPFLGYPSPPSPTNARKLAKSGSPRGGRVATQKFCNVYHTTIPYKSHNPQAYAHTCQHTVSKRPVHEKTHLHGTCERVCMQNAAPIFMSVPVAKAPHAAHL